jgi:MerR family transcriptional regulator, light-induced transcriptional regulator
VSFIKTQNQLNHDVKTLGNVQPAVAREATGPTFRSGAVARMANMPVATLRIWEQRYQAVQPTTAASGHRLYSPADVQRVLLLRRLTEQGHAIGSIAVLDSAQLERVAQQARQSEQAAQAPSGKAPGAGRRPARAAGALRLVVVGPALAARLQRPAVARQLAHAAQRVTVFESLAEAAQASAGRAADLLVWHAPALRPEVPAELRAAQQACGAGQLAVVYRFASAAATRALADAGAATLREPADDESLGAWLAAIEVRLSTRLAEAAAPDEPKVAQPPGTMAPRRYDDAALTAIAGMSPTLACECPRHVAELLMQLSSFEAYSAGCTHRGAADAQLHAYLQQVAGAARSLFEAALERVARHEGLSLR